MVDPKGDSARFDVMFDPATLDERGDRWGHRWRGSKKWRHALSLELLKPLLVPESRGPLRVLDIGCALCDFTAKAWRLNRSHKFCAMDISPNAIAWVSRNYPQFAFRVAALPDIPFDDQFDLIVCLEVLYYLDPPARRAALERIHRSLQPSGKLLVSARSKYFPSDAFLQLISDYFDITRVVRIHVRLYEMLEVKLLWLQSMLEVLTSTSCCQIWNSPRGARGAAPR